jgi:hypothetical protein
MVRRAALPLLAGLVAAAAAFGVAASLGGDEDGPAARPAATRPTAGGAAVFTRMGCGSCHRLAAASSTGEVGPSLDDRLPAHTRASLRAVILEPPANGVMPEDFGARMTPGELSALVDFLLDARRDG